MFTFTRHSLPAAESAVHIEAGGWVTFEGRVRAVNEGRAVTALEYELYETLAVAEGNRILAEATARFGLLHAEAVHRHGQLAVGEAAIRVRTAAMHRREAFLGAEYVVHEAKHRLPIWKKEFYADGTHQWVRCTHRAH